MRKLADLKASTLWGPLCGILDLWTHGAQIDASLGKSSGEAQLLALLDEILEIILLPEVGFVGLV